MNQTLLNKEDVMILDLLERVKKKGDNLIEESKKQDFIREIQLEDFSSEKRRFLVKLLVQNTELKLACKEEKGITNYVTPSARNSYFSTEARKNRPVERKNKNR
jgi:hypothetical protein